MVSEEKIRELAYSIWEQEGRPEGKDKENYFSAKKILEERSEASTGEVPSSLAPPKRGNQRSTKTKLSRKKRLAGVKCQKCGQEFSTQPNQYPGKVYVHHGEFLCEDCLVGMGPVPDGREDAAMLYTEGALYRVV